MPDKQTQNMFKFLLNLFGSEIVRNFRADAENKTPSQVLYTIKSHLHIFTNACMKDDIDAARGGIINTIISTLILYECTTPPRSDRMLIESLKMEYTKLRDRIDPEKCKIHPIDAAQQLYHDIIEIQDLLDPGSIKHKKQSKYQLLLRAFSLITIGILDASIDFTGHSINPKLPPIEIAITN